MNGKGFLIISLGMVLFFSAAGSVHGDEFSRNKNHKSPWFESVFEGNLIKASGREVDISQALKGKMVGVYFSASWCGPCKKFTPRLVKFYKQTAAKENLEIVFVSSDRTEMDMMNYMNKYSMPWLAVPFNNPSGKKLKRALNIRGIPTLVIFDSNGNKITTNARSDVTALGNRAVKAWKSSAKDQTPAFQERDRRRSESSGREPIDSTKWFRGPSDQWHIRMDTALNAAQKEQKKILVLYTASNFEESKKLQSEIFSSPEFLEFAREKLILVYLDIPQFKPMFTSQREYNEALSDVLQFSHRPTAYILDEQGRRIGFIRRYIPLDPYIKTLRKILESEGRRKRGMVPPDWIRKPPEQLASVMEQRRQERQREIAKYNETRLSAKQCSFQIVEWGLDKNDVTRPFNPRQEIRVEAGTKIYFKIRCRIPKGVKANIRLDIGTSGSEWSIVSGICSVVSPVFSKNPRRQDWVLVLMTSGAPESPPAIAAQLPCQIIWERRGHNTK